jgi:protein-L-isoaspartate(D-aspartate) O-methyltransferase
MKIIDVGHLVKAGVFQWDRDYLFKYLTTGRDPVLTNSKIITAFRNIDRAEFLPYKLKDQAYQDIDLDIGYGENITRPSIIGEMLELLRPKTGGKYLDIGSGTGYFAMLLGFVVGPQGKVFSLDRIQWLWEQCRQNAAKYKDITNVSFLYRDGMEGLIQQAPFDGIHISFSMPQVSETLKNQLSPDRNILVMPTTNHDIRVLERNGDDFVEEIVPGYVFKEGRAGVS